MANDDERPESGAFASDPSFRSRRFVSRRLVPALIAVTGIVALAVGVRVQIHARAAHRAPVVASEPSQAPSAVAAAEPTSAAEGLPQPDAIPANEPSALPEASGSATKMNGAGNPGRRGVQPKSYDPPTDPLKKETLSLLNRGKAKEAVELARRSIEADPTDAVTYLYLGTALQDSGHPREALEAYSECARHATRGPVGDCRLLGGRK
jgi:Flp pilus assembly protein TadD